MNIIAMLRVILWVSNAVIGEARLPDGEIQIEFLLHTI